MNNKRLDIEPMFQTENEAWDFIHKAMQQPTRPKMMWVTKKEESDGHVSHDCNSGR